MDVMEGNGFTERPLMTVNSKKVESHSENGEDESEVNTLLPPRREGISKNPERVGRKVQWNDNKGNKLVEILVFDPSDNSDSDEEATDSCSCNIM